MLRWALDKLRCWLFNRQRYVYRFWDGSRTRVADPLACYRDLIAHEDFRVDDLKLLSIPSFMPDKAKTLAKAYRDVFKVKQVEDGGLTDVECVHNLQDFLGVAYIQKKSGETHQTLPTSTDTEVSPDSADQTNTGDGLGSTSTVTDSLSTEPSQSPQELASASTE
jgi:hypothetical protein